MLKYSGSQLIYTMKKIISIILLVLFANLLSAQGIKFFEGTFKEALEKAKLENKKVFVDVYTDW